MRETWVKKDLSYGYCIKADGGMQRKFIEKANSNHLSLQQLFIAEAWLARTEHAEMQAFVWLGSA